MIYPTVFFTEYNLVHADMLIDKQVNSKFYVSCAKHTVDMDKLKLMVSSNIKG